MTLLVLGVSHRSAPLSLLDKAAIPADVAVELAADASGSMHVAEALVVATCNRVEIYADVAKFHPAVEDVTEAFAKRVGVPRDELTPHLYLHYDEAAVQHMFAVAAGLDSMVVGEQQIRGQVRSALTSAQETGTVGRSLNDVAQQALRVGKRVQSETGIDRHGASIVSVALDETGLDLSGIRALVVGAGSMSALAATTLVRRGVSHLTIANRSNESAERLAQSLSSEGSAHVEVTTLSRAAELLGEVDLVVSCTGARGYVLELADFDRPDVNLTLVDLALPMDTDPAVGRLPRVRRIDIASLADAPGAVAPAALVSAAHELVEAEVVQYMAAHAAESVEPIVVSLRSHATAVLESELQRLRARMPHLSDAEFAEVEWALRRTVSTLLHTPTVRMKQFAADPGGEKYAEALHALFDLDPRATDQEGT